MQKGSFLRLAAVGVSLIGAVSLSSCGGSGSGAGSTLSAQDAALAALTIDTPPPGTYITAANDANFVLAGTCAYNGGTVTLQTTFPVIGTAICIANTWSISLDVSFIFDGTLTFTANHTGLLGEVAPTVSQDYIKDTLSPTGAKIVIGDGVTIPTSTNVALTLTATGATRMYITNTAGCASGGVDEAFAANKAWTLAPVGNSATVYAIFRDDAGNASPCVSATTQVNITAAPTVAIVSPAAGSYINLANQAAFVVSGICSPNGSTVMISGAVTSSAPCTAGAWTATLNFSAVADGPVTINADITLPESISAVTSTRSFIKDTVGPLGTIAINSGAGSTASTAVTLTLNSVDAADMYITNTAGCTAGGAFEAYATSKPWVLGQTIGTATVYVAFRDLAGNVGPCVSDQITVTAPPLVITPSSISLSAASAQTVNFVASGGVGPYVFSIVSGQGTVGAATGIYFVAAGATGTTVVRVTDSTAATADAVVTHTPAGVMPKDCREIQLIGMKSKCGAFDDSDRHSIFMPMDGNVKILLQEGDFKVIDGNGTDGMAAISLPNPDPAHTGTLAYRVYTRLVGKPGGSFDEKTCASDPANTANHFCSQNTLSMDRMAGTPKFKDASSALLFVNQAPLFSSTIGNSYWDVDTMGRAHVQVRFCVESTAR